ncbi:LPD23 domain-containing protein [Flavobacterium sp.]|uniref:LPD23 domain-containing protein n=1 Tax=Flavobacterium sp. TaxID=239 RepID=UPI003D6B290F
MPDPRNKLYVALSGKFDLGSYEEFNTKMDNPQSRQKLYNAVSKDFDLGSYEEFEGKISPQKKKAVPTSSGPNQKLDSNGDQGTFSGGVGKSPLKYESPFKQKKQEQIPSNTESSQYEEGTMAWNLDKLSKTKDFIELDNRVKQATDIPEERANEIKKEVEDEANNVGVLNKLNKFGNEFFNKVPKIFGGFGGEKELDPLHKEKREAVDLLTKKGYKQADITNDLVKRTAIDIKAQKRINSERDSKMRDFLSDAEDVYDGNMQSSLKDKLKFQENIKVAGKNQQKSFLEKKVDLKDQVILSRRENLEKLNQEITDLHKKGEDIPPDLLMQHNEELKNFQSSIKEAISAREEFAEKDTDLKDAQSNLDYFKRDYGKIKNFFGNAVLGFEKITTGLMGAADYGLELKQSVLGESAVDESMQNIIHGEIKSTDKFYNENVADKIMKPMAVEDIHSMNDLGRWVGNTAVASQVPIYMAIASGAGGIGAIGAESTGAKYESMVSEMNPENAEPGQGVPQYSEAQLLGVPAGYGLAETASAMITRINMGNAAKIIKSASGPERTMIAQGFWKEIAGKGGDVVKGGAMEYADEAATQIIENYLDKNVLGKDVSLLDGVNDAGMAGLVMGAAMPAASHIVNQATKPFSVDNKVQNISKEILELQTQLDKAAPETKDIIKKQIKDKENQVSSLLKKRISNMESLSDQQFQEVIRLEKAQQTIKNQAKEIKSDTNIDDEMTDKILGDLESEFRANDQRRLELLNGGATVALEKMVDDEKEVSKLKETAEKQLVKELNPDGTKDVKIEEEQIAKKAIQIFNKKNTESKIKEGSKGVLNNNIYTLKNGEEYAIKIFDGINGEVKSFNDRENKDRLSFSVQNKNGENIANITFWQDKDGKFYSNNTNVNEQYRRKGIATAVYNFAESLGIDIKPSNTQTKMGESFYNTREKRKDDATYNPTDIIKKENFDYKTGESSVVLENNPTPDEEVQKSDISPDIILQSEPSEEEIQVAEKAKIKAENFKDLYNVNRKVFGQNKVKSFASAVVMDRIVGTMADRANTTKEDIYSKLEFKKSSEDEIKNLSDKGKVLYQIAGKNAKLSKEIKDNLSIARKMETSGADTKNIRVATGWEKGADGKWGYEIDDSKTSLNQDIDDLTRGSLSDLLNHKELFELYPDLAKVEVVPNYNMESSAIASPSKNRIMVNPDNIKGNQDLLTTILHEVQHFIQEKEGFSKGGSEETVRQILEENISNKTTLKRITDKLFGKKSKVTLGASKQSNPQEILNQDDYKLYESLVGEVQARNVETRQSMSPEDRKNTLLSETEDISRESQIILFQDSKGAAQIGEDGKAVIHALTDPDVSTPLHELAHVYEHYLTDDERNHILDLAGTKEWNTETSEFFARGFEKYLADGTAPDPKMQKIFDKFKEWLTDIYNGIKDSEIDIKLNKEMNDIYSKMLGVEPKSESKNSFKASENGKAYSSTFKDGVLTFKDEKGNEPSAPTRRKLQDEWANKFDFTSGRTISQREDVEGFNEFEYESMVAEYSENPVEVAEALLNLDILDYMGGIGHKEKVIAENIGSKSIDRQSFIDNSDANNITQGIAMQYFAKKGQGAPLDTMAQEMSEQAGVDITEQDIVDFILDNPRGTENFMNQVKNEKTGPLKDRFMELTGLPANDKYLDKAISQMLEKQEQLENASSLDFMSDEDFISLYNQIQQSENESNEPTEKTETDKDAKGVSETKNNPARKPKSGVQGKSGSKADGDTRKPKPVKKTDSEFDNSDLEDDTEVQQQGMFSGNKQNQRDLLLSSNGPVKLRFPFQKMFKRVFAQTFKANAGLDTQTGEVVRSRNRTLSAFTDHLEHESNEFNKIIRDIKKNFPKKVNENLLAINDYLSGEKSADVSFLNPDQKKQLDYFRERIDSLSESVIQNLKNKVSDLEEKVKKQPKGSIGIESINGAIERTKNLIDTIESNKEKYINRSYQIFSDDAYRDNITGDFENLNKEGQLRIRNAINFLIREDGMTKAEATKAVAEYLSEIRRSKSDFPFSSNGSAAAPFLKKRKTIPKEFRELLGESKDPIYNYVNTVYKLSQYIGNLEYQSKLREHLLDNNIGKLEPALGYVKLTSDGEGWGILSDIYVPVDFKDAMDDMQPLQKIESGFYKAWIKTAGLVKINKTILSPTTMARNLISGVFLGVNAGHFFLSNPKAMAIAWNNAWTTNKSQKELFAERQKLLKSGVLGDGSNSGELLAILNDFSKEVDRMISKNAFEKFFDIAKKAYAFGDDFYKVTGFYIEKSRLMSYGLSETEAEEKAAFRVNNGYPTYSYLPKNMQRLRRLPLIGTFVSFPYESIRSTKNNLLIAREDLKEGRTKLAYQRLAGMLAANATLNGLSALTMAMVGMSDDDDDAIRDMLPEWQRNSKLIYLGTKNGKPIFVDGTALFPSETIFKPISTLLEQREGRKFDDKLQESLNELLSPYISKDITFKTLMEVSENEDQFNDKIYLSDNLMSGIANEPAKIANYLMKQAGPGAYNNVTEFLRANEIAPQYFGDKFSAYGKEYTNQEALMGLLGMRISTINYNSAMSSFAFQVKDAEKSDKSSASKLVKTSKVLSENEIENIVEDYSKYHDQNFEKMINIVNSGKKMGMSDGDIRSSLKVSKLSNSDISALIQGKVPILKPLSEQSIKSYKEKLTINYKGKDIQEIKKNFDKNVQMLAKKIAEFNKENKTKKRPE